MLKNVQEQLLKEGRKVFSIISHRPVTSSDLKQERSVFRRSVSTFLQLFIAQWETALLLTLLTNLKLFLYVLAP